MLDDTAWLLGAELSVLLSEGSNLGIVWIVDALVLLG